MTINQGMMSSDSHDWETPPDLFARCDAIWHFDLDVASSDENALCENHFTREDDGLSKDWSGHRVWMNPPYGREIGKWVKKAAEESQKPDTVVVGLIPNRTDTAWYQQYVLPYAAEIVPLAGRVRFCMDGEPQQSAPFPSALVRWGGGPSKTGERIGSERRDRLEQAAKAHSRAGDGALQHGEPWLQQRGDSEEVPHNATDGSRLLPPHAA